MSPNARSRTLFQFSDVHVVDDGATLNGVDTLANLETALRLVEGSDIRPDALVFTGDLSDTGAAEHYDRLLGLVEPVCARLGVPACYAMGNHDDRMAFRARVLRTEPSMAECDYTVWIGGLRLIVLDTSIPGQVHGDLTDAQLSWLSRELTTRAPEGTVLAMHHPPMRVPLNFEPFTLQNPERLAEMIIGTDVRIVLCGHAHQSSAGSIGGVPVSACGATAYRLDALSNNLRGVKDGVFSRIDLFAGGFGGGAVATQLPIRTDDVLYQITPDELAAQLAGTAQASPSAPPVRS